MANVDSSIVELRMKAIRFHKSGKSLQKIGRMTAADEAFERADELEAMAEQKESKLNGRYYRRTG